jgi:cation-transporting ATPase 13A1
VRKTLYSALNVYGSSGNVTIRTAHNTFTCVAYKVLSGPQRSSTQSCNCHFFTGDPLEVATMSATGYAFQPSLVADGTTTIADPNTGVELKVRAKFPFSSDLKRMSVIVECSGPRAGVHAATLQRNVSSTSNAGSSSSSSSSNAIIRQGYVFTKGAPEILASHLNTIPDYYNATYFYHMSRGRRVLALAYKTLLPHWLDGKGAKLPRTAAESGLTFAGFLIFDCDLKPDSRSVVRELRQSNHQVVMITGDSVYTAADVARRLSMLHSAQKGDKGKGEAQALIIHVVKRSAGEDSELVWRRLTGLYAPEEEKQMDDIDFNLAEVKELAGDYSLCVVGQALDTLQKQDPTKYAAALRALCPHVTIFARVSPAQKEAIVLALNGAGLYTLMCGDGTNDVGALKAAHVGVSIVNSPELERRIEGAGDNAVGGAGKT